METFLLFIATSLHYVSQGTNEGLYRQKPPFT